MAKVNALAGEKYSGDVMGNIVAIYTELTADERRLLVLKAVDANPPQPVVQRLPLDEFHRREMVCFKFFCFKALVAWVLSGLLTLLILGVVKLDCTQTSELSKLITLYLNVFGKIVDLQ